jgi:serine/threonine-protein kinase
LHEPTAESSGDDTVPNSRPPEPSSPLFLPPAAPPGPTALLISLSVALILALLGIVILLLRK